MPYQVLDHLADYEILVTGKDLSELFATALAGMMAFLKGKLQVINNKPRLPMPTGRQAAGRVQTISVNSNDRTNLLIDFLGEALRLAQTNKEIYSKVRFKQLSETSLQAELFGTKIDGFDNDIKAVTYHLADVHKNSQGDWETLILFDI